VNFDLPGGQTRAILEYEGVKTGVARKLSNLWTAQLQVKF
jgi:hypothetical protein